MATIQDINALKDRIYDAVQEYLQNAESYQQAALHIYLDEGDMLYKAEIAEGKSPDEDNGYYLISGYIRTEDGIDEPDIDEIDELANSWIFLD